MSTTNLQNIETFAVRAKQMLLLEEIPEVSEALNSLLHELASTSHDDTHCYSLLQLAAQ